MRKYVNNVINSYAQRELLETKFLIQRSDSNVGSFRGCGRWMEGIFCIRSFPHIPLSSKLHTFAILYLKNQPFHLFNGKMKKGGKVKRLMREVKMWTRKWSNFFPLHFQLYFCYFSKWHLHSPATLPSWGSMTWCGRSMGCGAIEFWVWILVLLLANCMALGKSFSFSPPQFCSDIKTLIPHSQNRYGDYMR